MPVAAASLRFAGLFGVSAPHASKFTGVVVWQISNLAGQLSRTLIVQAKPAQCKRNPCSGRQPLETSFMGTFDRYRSTNQRVRHEV